MKNLRKNWGQFLGVMLSPGSVIFIVITIVGLILAYVFKENTLFATLLSILSAIFGGVAGSFIKDDYTKLSSENILEKKGRSATRNLQSIGKQLAHICGWIAEFSKEKISKEQKRTLEEIDRHLSTARMNVDAGFSDWVDIVPELAEEEEIERKTEETLKAYAEEWLRNQKALVENTDEQRSVEIKDKLTDLEKQIKHIEQIQDRWIGRDRMISHGPTHRYISSGSRITRCVMCGRFFPHMSTSAVGEKVICPICKRKANGPDTK